MATKIVITTPAIAYRSDEKKVSAVKWLRELDGIRVSDDVCSNYFEFGDSLDEANVVGGEISLRFNPTTKKLESIVTYRCDTKLNSPQKKKLLDETRGQLSDGMGAGPLELPAETPIVFVDLAPARCKSSLRQTATKKSKGHKRSPKRKVNVRAAAENGNLERIQLAIDSGIDINSPSKGFYPLGLAVLGGQVEAVKLLIANGANLESRDRQDFAPLHTCIASSGIQGKDRGKILKLLLDAGAKVNAKADVTGDKTNPLQIAFDYGRGKAIKELLKKHGGKKMS